MAEIRKVRVQTAQPRGDFAGAVAEGFYTVKDGAVLLVDEMGNAIDRFKLYRKLKAGEDAHGVAASLLRQWKRPRGSDFSRPLRYPRIAY